MPSPRLSRAAALLRTLLNSSALSPERLARELAISEDALEQFGAGTLQMPLGHQLCLALLVIRRVPEQRREAHRLLGQVRAATAFERHDTVTHAAPPPRYLERQLGG